MNRLITYFHQAFIWLNDPLNWTNPDGILARTAEHLEIAHVVWCASGHDEDDHSASWPVATYWPDWYAGARVPVIPL